MVAPRKRFFRRVTMGEASAVVGGVVDAWRIWAGWDNGLLKMGYFECWRWGRRARCGNGGSRRRTCGWQRMNLTGGGLIIIVVWLIGSVVEIC